MAFGFKEGVSGELEGDISGGVVEEGLGSSGEGEEKGFEEGSSSGDSKGVGSMNEGGCKVMGAPGGGGVFMRWYAF